MRKEAHQNEWKSVKPENVGQLMMVCLVGGNLASGANGVKECWMADPTTLKQERLRPNCKNSSDSQEPTRNWMEN